jgi:hypothetical protein
MDRDSRISAPVLIYVQVSASQAQVGEKHSSPMARKILILRFFNCLCTLQAERGRGVVGSDWSSDSDPVIYQIAFEFERRGVTGEDGRAGQLFFFF